MNWTQFKDPVSPMYLACTVVASWSLTREVVGSSPLTVMTNIFVSEIFRKNSNGGHLLIITRQITIKVQVRIQDLVKGGPQVLRLNVADVAKHSCVSEASNFRPWSRAHLRALEAFGFLMLKYAFSHILETLFL